MSTPAQQRRYRNRRTGPTRYNYVRSTHCDDIALERAILGDPPRVLTIAERAEVVARLTARGLTARRIGDILGLNQRTVVRYRVGLHKTLGGPGWITAGAA